MHSNSVLKAKALLDDMRDNILLARKFIAGLTEVEFHGDVRTIYAVTRCLEIISEASRQLPLSLKQRHDEIPWSNIAGAGSIYRHAYGSVSSPRIWETIATLPALLTVVEKELALLQSGTQADEG